MSLAFKDHKEPEYGTKTDIHYMFRVSQSRIADCVRKGKLAIHLIDGKVQINIEEARQVFRPEKTDNGDRQKNDLFSA
jgi:hypothetical protein